MPGVSKEFSWTSDDWLSNKPKCDIELNVKMQNNGKVKDKYIFMNEWNEKTLNLKYQVISLLIW